MLRQAEVEDLHDTVPREEDVCGLQVAVDDSLPVRRREALSHLHAELDRRAGGEPRAAQARRERLAFQQLGDDVGSTVVGADVVHRQDVRMVELAGRTGFQLETSQPSRIGGDLGRQHFDRDIPAQAGVAGTVDLPHPARPDRRHHFVGAQLRPGSERHDSPPDRRPASHGGGGPARLYRNLTPRRNLVYGIGSSRRHAIQRGRFPLFRGSEVNRIPTPLLGPRDRPLSVWPPIVVSLRDAASRREEHHGPGPSLTHDPGIGDEIRPTGGDALPRRPGVALHHLRRALRARRGHGARPGRAPASRPETGWRSSRPTAPTGPSPTSAS